MSKMRFMPVLSLLFLLTACNGGSAPTFAKEGDEVDFTDFYFNFNKALSENEIYDDTIILKDRLLKYSYYSHEVNSTKRDGKEINKTETTRQTKGEQSFDYDSRVGKDTYETKYTAKTSNQEGNADLTTNSKEDYYYQFGRSSAGNGVLELNTKTKMYSNYVSLNDSEKGFDSLVRSFLDSSIATGKQYLPQTSLDSFEEDLFYVKGDSLFTMSRIRESESEDNTTIRTVKTRLKVQIDLTDKKEAVRISSEETEEITYKSNYMTYREWDVQTIDSKVYIEQSITAKDINLEKKDLDGYIYGQSYNYVY